MNIDWFTISAQAINFLILIWLLKRFLYKPVLHAIDAREQRIAETLSQAETLKLNAEAQQKDYESKLDQLQDQRGDFLAKAQSDADLLKDKLLLDAQTQAKTNRKIQNDALIVEAKTLEESVIRRIQQQVLDISRKVLLDLADTSLDARMVAAFTSRLGEMCESDRKLLIGAVSESSGAIQVSTAFPLAPELRSMVSSSIHSITGKESSVVFESHPELISGIELRVQGHKLAWSVSDFLYSLDEGLLDFVKASIR